MKPSWSTVREALESLLELDPEQRGVRLRELAASDAELEKEVRELLRHEEHDEFLERAPGAEPAPGETLSLAAGKRIGEYELIRPLGTGGMGTVWEARQESPARRVALKMLSPSRRGWSRADVWRFEHEARVLASLQHPHIAQVHRSGVSEVQDTTVLWIAMELVEDGRPLQAWVRERKLPRSERLLLFETLCDAVQHGHQRGVIHRDIKPSNVLVTEAEGKPRLMLIDFGIARAVDESDATPSLRTRTGELVGTLEYMAPEQIEGRTDLDVRCDVYALGVLLYELLCDAPPLELAGVLLTEAAEKIRFAEPRSPSSRDASLAGDLESIVLRALEKDRSRRYASAADLADDLRRHRRDEPVEARPASAPYRLVKFVRRNRVAALLATALVLGLVATAGGTTYGLLEAKRAETRALEEEDKAVAAAEEAQRQELIAADERDVARREAEGNRQMVGLLRHVFDGIDTTQRGRDTRVVEMLQSADLDWSPLDGIDPKLAVEFHHMLAGVYDSLDAEPDAVPHLERALELATQHPDVLSAGDLLRLQADLGFDLTRAQKSLEGQALLRNAMRDAAELEDTSARLAIGYRMLLYLADRREWVELAELAEEQAALAETALEDEQRLRALQTLGFALSNLGRADEAIAILEQVHGERTDLYGERSTRTLDTFASLIQAQVNAGRYGPAEENYAAATELFLEVLGPENRRTLEFLGNHAYLLIQLRRFDEADARLSELVELYEAGDQANGHGHAVAVQNLGMLYNMTRRYPEAEALLRRSYDMGRRLLPEDDLNLAQFRFNLGACLAWQKKFEEAEEHLLAAWAQLEAVLPAGHVVLKQALRTLGDAYAQNGDEETAARWRAELGG